MLNRLLGQTDLASFLGNDWGRNLKVLRDVDVGVHWDWDSALAFIEDGGLAYPDLKVLDQHGEVHPRDYVPTGADVFSSHVSPKHVKRLLFEGKTVRIAKVQRFLDEARTLLRGLKGEVPGVISINAYLSFGETVGLKPHYDPQHTFAVQLDGEKQWHFGSIVCDFPTPDVRPAIAETISEVATHTARPGDAIYFPPGMWHFTRTVSRSLHITVGVQPPTWVDFLRSLVDRASRIDPVLRAPQQMRFVNGELLLTGQTDEEVHVLLRRLQLAHRAIGGATKTGE